MKILVVDDHPLILEASRNLLRNLDASITLVEAQSAQAGRLLLKAHADISLALLDIGLPGITGFEFLEEVRRDFPEVAVVVLSGSDARAEVIQALDLGAMGYIPKSSTSQQMLAALRLVLSGGVYVPPMTIDDHPPGIGTARPQARSGDRHVTARDLGLTERQSQVLRLLLEGKPNKLICRELKLAEGTVKVHVAAILRALNVANRTQAIIELSRIGLKIESGVKAT
jgi:DNA-binding NarL/FixJ family response regulator